VGVTTKKREKLYCALGVETAYGIGWWQSDAFDRQEPVKIELQKADGGSGIMWCTTEGEFVERGCSYGCDAYAPCNGKSGRCRFMKNSLTGAGKFFMVSPAGDVEAVAL